MHTDTHTPPESDNSLTDEVRARVPKWMKLGVKTVKEPRLLEEADIVREALAEYLKNRGVATNGHSGPKPEAA